MHKMHQIDDLNFASVRDFCAVAELRSFQRAAEKRRISQPALSRRMQALERSLGATLLDRKSHPVCLTKAGEAFLPFAIEALKEISEGAELFRAVVTGLSDPITIAATHTVAVSFFPKWIGSLSLPEVPKGIVLNAFRNILRMIIVTRRALYDFIASKTGRFCIYSINTR